MTQDSSEKDVEPWLRGTLGEVDAVRRQVLHALELSGEDAVRWCAGMSDAEVHARPCGLASVAFHLRHMTRSLDRLMTYAEGRGLSEEQLGALRTEMAGEGTVVEVMGEFAAGLARARERVLAVTPETFDEVRWVGRDRLTTTVGGLVVHCAEHTQRHVGQMITTAKVVASARNPQSVEPFSASPFSASPFSALPFSAS